MKPFEDHINDEFRGSVTKAAKYYGKSRAAIYRRVDRGDYYAVKYGAHWQTYRFDMAAEDLSK